MKRCLFLAALVLFSLQSLFAQSSPVIFDSLATRVLNKEQLQEDFTYLRKILEETHPGLYRYTPKEAMQRKMDSIMAALNTEMGFYDYYRVIAAFIAGIRCAHTYAIPVEEIEQYLTNNIKTIPFEVTILQNRAFVTLNGTTETTVKPGYELLTINGQPVNAILPELYRHIWSDGYNESNKANQLIGIKFGLFYYMLVARPDTFAFTMADAAGKRIEIKTPALPFKEYYAQLFKNPVNKNILAIYQPRNEKDKKQGWRLEMLEEPQTALLRIKGFGGGDNTKEAAQKMRAFMDKTIGTLQKKNIRNLVVDLRSNGGGWDIQGIELFTYLMKDTIPVRYYLRKHAVTDSSAFLKFSDLSPEDMGNLKKELKREADGTFTVREEFNEDLKMQDIKTNRFTGNIYFLINGGSASTTAEFTAVAHTHKLGIFIGTETGGAYEGGNGGSFLHFHLPNSRIYIGTPLLYYENAVKAPLHQGRGTMPDYQVPSTINDMLNGRDTQLEFALDLIRKNSKR
jgi:hypothetical protein